MTGINYEPQYASYGVAGEMLGLGYFGYSETRTYNALLQMTHVTVPGMMDMQYVYAAGANNGRITQTVDGVAGETVNYGYDALNRLSTAGATNGSWGQAFTYDGFGNLTGKTVTQGSALTLSVSFDPATNRQYGVNYDANGNVMQYQSAYDVENRLVGDSTALYVYDHAGKRVEKRYQATEEYYFYGIGGQKLVTQVCQTTESGWGCTGPQYNVYFGGKLVVSKGVVVVTDRLGSVRANSAGERMSYFPYGEEKTTTADGREKFGTYTRDSATQDYADQRYYAVGMGRFNSPDPSTGVQPGQPATWNKYAYVVGDPVNFKDRRGLFYSQAGNDDDDDYQYDMDDGTGSGSGGERTSGDDGNRKQGGGGGTTSFDATYKGQANLAVAGLHAPCKDAFAKLGISVANLSSQALNTTYVNATLYSSEDATLNQNLFFGNGNFTNINASGSGTAYVPTNRDGMQLPNVV